MGASALPDDGGLDVGAVSGDAAVDDVEMTQDELEGRDAVAERRGRVEPGGVGANVVEDQGAPRLEHTVEMPYDRQWARQVLERLEADNRVEGALERRIVIRPDRHHAHKAIVAELPSRVVEEQVWDVGADELEIEVSIGPREGGQDRRGATAVLDHPSPAGYPADERMNAEGRKRETERVCEEMVDYPRVPPRLEVLVIQGECRVFDVLEMDRLEPLAVDAGEKVEVVRTDGPVAELLHPVALEFVKPAESEVRVDEAAVEPELHERAQPIEQHPTAERAQRSEPISA